MAGGVSIPFTMAQSCSAQRRNPRTARGRVLYIRNGLWTGSDCEPCPDSGYLSSVTAGAATAQLGQQFELHLLDLDQAFPLP